MAAGDTTLFRPGQDLAAGSNTALLHTFYEQLVQRAFERATVFMDKVETRFVPQGNNSQTFYFTGVGKAVRHVDGESTIEADKGYTYNSKQTKLEVFLDQPIVSTMVLQEIDALRMDPDTFSIHVEGMGKAIAVKVDNILMRLIALAARTSKRITDTGGFRSLPGGEVIAAGATVATDSSVLLSALSQAQTKLKEHDVISQSAPGEVFVALAPEHFELLRNNTSILNSMYGGPGNLRSGELPEIYGMKIVESNNLSSSVVAGETGENNTYSGDFSDTIAIVWTRQAVVNAMWKELSLEKIPHPERLNLQYLSKMYMGASVFRPECAIEITKA